MKLVPAKVGAQPKQLAISGRAVGCSGRSLSAESNTVDSSFRYAVSNGARGRGADGGYCCGFSQDSASPPRGSILSQRGPVRGSSPMEDFRPSLKLKEGMDVSRIDPTLRLDLLAKLQQAPMEGGSRSIFEFSKPPAPPPPKVAPIKPGPLPVANAKPGPGGPDSKAPVTPPLPPIPLKYYGYANGPRGAVRRAFFLDGDDIFVAGENELIHNRYKIISIGVNSAVVEDTTNKNQQTLRLVEELAG